MEEYIELEKGAKRECFQTLYRHKKQPLLLAWLKEGESWQKETAEELLADNDASILLLLYRQVDSVLVRCSSETEEVRALELLDFLFGQYGILKGDARNARGSISHVLLGVCMSEADVDDSLAFFKKRASDYFEQVESIDASHFASEHEQQIKELEVYTKRQISWAYVKTTDIAEAGKELGVRTLENDTGVTLLADSDTYIMIGCRGEVYEINREKFEASYDASEQPLDIFTQLLDFIPAVEVLPEHTYLPIDEIAHLCYPKQGARIFAKRLEKRTKIFGKGSRDYFIGKPGDYMAIRCDDLQDIYIIQDAVFDRTYERVNEKAVEELD